MIMHSISCKGMFKTINYYMNFTTGIETIAIKNIGTVQKRETQHVN